MNYEQKYIEALERAKYTLTTDMDNSGHWAVNYIFPELKESESERMKKVIMHILYENYTDAAVIEGVEIAEIVAWLEKQGKQPSDKIDTKFKVGDCVVDDETPNDVFCVIEVLGEIYKVIDIDGDDYHIPHCKADKQFHLWTLQDAKDGDVLAFDDNTIVIFKDLYNAITFHSYCHIEDGLFGVNEDGSHRWEGEGFQPATKEQRDILFTKMKEAGYEWDAEKKELRKIKPHYDVKNFHAGMPVLVRIYDNHKWCYLLFSHCYKHQGILQFSCGGAGWLQCIPFEGNEHLLGTTDMCDEKFINW